MTLLNHMAGLAGEQQKALYSFFSEPRLQKYAYFLSREKCLPQALKLNEYIGYSHADAYSSLQLINLFELFLRNRLHNVFSAHYGSDWVIERIFKEQAISKEMRQKIEYALKKQRVFIGKSGKQSGRKVINSDRLVHDLDFGFWTGLFSGGYSHHWPPVFSAFYTGVNSTQPWSTFKTELHAKTTKKLIVIKNWRNRISHLQPWKPNYSYFKATLEELIDSMDPTALSIVYNVLEENPYINSTIFKTPSQITIQA